jgi:uncharacterized lipoprotein YehR (DUF1307 family)
MKKSVRILSVVMAVLMLCLTLASCGKKLSGKYSAEALGSGATFEFKGSKVTIAVKLLGTEVGSAEGTYEIKDDKITFDIADEEEIDNAIAKKAIAELEKPADFEEGEDYIKIGGAKYEAVKD